MHIAMFGRGHPILLLHGFPQHWYAWRKLVPLLSDDFRLLCIDLRGFGWSEQTRDGYSLNDLASDVVALIDVLELPSVGLVGHDWGAQVGFRVCFAVPERIDAFVALNMVHPWPQHRQLLPNLWRMWFTAFIEYPVLGRWVLGHWPSFTRYMLRREVADPGEWHDEDLREFVEATQVSAHAGQSLFWQYVARDIPNLVCGVNRRQHLSVPTVLIGSEHDPIMPPGLLTGGEKHADRLGLRIVPGAGHYLNEERPELIADAVRGVWG